MKNYYYYAKELQKIIPEGEPILPIKFKMTNENITTKWMNLNLESVEILQTFLTIVKKDLEVGEK